MVVLVVTLLTTAILFRSFDRSKNASNYRVNEVVLNAAAPALDRARAKLNRLFSADETELPGNTPADDDIARVFEDNEYTFGDETQLKLVADLDDNSNFEDNEKLKTAWKFPVDTDNNGVFDSFTLYGIYFRTPDTADNRDRGPLEARSMPQLTGIPDGCAAGNGGGTGNGDNGWYPIGGQIKKAFFTYVATVPITKDQKDDLDANGYKPNIPGDKFEIYTGNKGFSALEMQQDQARLALDNNAVWYEDDLIITDVPAGGFRLNGRIQANGNLMVGSKDTETGPITFYQVSSPYSCYYTAQNGKIIVAGNVTANGIAGDTDQENRTNDKVKLHLFKTPNQAFDETAAANFRVVDAVNVTTNSPPRDVAYNTRAYAQRLNLLVTAALNEYGTNAPTVNGVRNFARFPTEIADQFEDKYPDPSLTTLSDDEARNLLRQIIEVYFKERIRRVPFVEVPIEQPELALGTFTEANVFSGGGTIKAPEEWMEVDNLNTAPLSLKTDELEQTPNLPSTAPEEEIGDRILVGNGLPTRWLKTYGDPPTYADAKEPQPIGNGRERESQARTLEDLGDTSRNGFWEKAAASHENVPGDEELAGGLRVITGAGIYIDGISPSAGGTGKRIGEAQGNIGRYLGYERSFLPEPSVTATQLQAINAEINPGPGRPVTVVWPDTMPMYRWNDRNGDGTDDDRYEVFKGDLQMRATVVYHYANGGGSQSDQPIACISSYYDPTNANTAANEDGLPGGQPLGRSNNGINYPIPTDRTITPTLRRQAYMVFPDGRWANKPLKDAVEAGGNLSLENKAAIDAANCALSILNGASPTGSDIPDDAIRERAFLDARQVKTLHKPDVEFNADGITFDPLSTEIIDRQTFLTDANADALGKVLIADPEQVKIATQRTLNEPVNTKNPAPAEYSLPIEERQPLEIRVTEIDLEPLRTTQFGTIPAGKPQAGDSEYLLPYSGIIYASRDDALPDITDVDLINAVDGGSSATDFKVDPSRRPNGIRLRSSGNNGGRLSRGTDNADNPLEKGLILASNVPVYIKGDFNRHLVAGSNTATEEFVDKLDDDYSDFYTRGQALDNNFACRQRTGSNCATGDQWRAARILADSITLLSKNFRDGFREEGNYDFNNNAGNLVVAQRLKNGFWWNGFATNYAYQDTAGTNVQYPVDADFAPIETVTKGSSYAMNGVTPIQRRVNFPEYQMEICPKLPISECGPQDWLRTIPQGLSGAGNPAGGSTAAPTPNAADTWRDIAPQYSLRDYPRRVAFERNEFGQVVLNNTDLTATPWGIRSGTPQPIPYSTSNVGANPDTADNALWFWTTDANAKPNDPVVPTAPPPHLTGFDYNSEPNNSRLYYIPDDLEDAPTERQMLLPGTPKFPTELGAINTAFTVNDSSVLNGNTGGDPSDYSVCIGNGESQNYQVAPADFSNGTCPVLVPIRQMWQALTSTSLVDLPDSTNPTIVKVTAGFDPAVTDTATAESKVNVLDLATNTLTGSLTLNRGQQLDPIFIIRYIAGPQPLTFSTLTLKLEGVDPNNIFWVSRRGMRIQNTATELLAGNFIGGPQGRIRIDEGAAIKGGRFLGFGGTGSSLTSGSMTALTTTAQPLLVPVLQLHSPEGQPNSNINQAFVSSDRDSAQMKWLQRATTTEYNAVLVMGDTPARPYPNGGENNGGLHNFPRFLENWVPGGATARIKGSLIQYIKSKYATGPFDTVDLVAQDNSLFFDSDPGTPPDYIEGSNPSVGTPGYQYSEAAADNKAPFYQPPTRAWGYDVGLLSQTPDLFSRRIALPEAGTPNEFFREVSRDDAWVQGLLCAAEKTDPTDPNSSYKWALADPSQRSGICQAAGSPGGQYND
jgi:type II secretory pathway pseudopilin PulG